MAESACPGSLPPLYRRHGTSAVASGDNGEEDDRMSLLPDAIIHHIFSFLPTRDVFKTRVLSTRLRRLCFSVPTLDFSLCRDAPLSSMDSFCSFIDTVLDLRSPTDVASFHLDLPYIPRHVKSKLESWLWFATVCRVKDLRLELPGWENLCSALRLIHDCPSLVELRLCGERMGFELSSGVINWASLRVLSMAYLRLTDDEIRAVFAGSPALESLELQRCGSVTRIEVHSRWMRELVIDGWKHWPFGGPPRLEVSAPHLQTLRLRGDFPRMDLRLAEISSIAEAELNFSMSIDGVDRLDYYKWSRNLVGEILQKLRNATKFVVGCWYLQVVSHLEEGDLPPLLPSCKSLILNTPCRSWECHGILNMMERSLQVEKLVIKMNQPLGKSLEFDMDFGKQGYSGPLERKNKLKCLDQHLRRVDVVRFDPMDTCSSSLLGLLEFILKEARVLDRILINACKVKADRSNSAEALYTRKLFESFLKYRWASKNAQVVLYYD